MPALVNVWRDSGSQWPSTAYILGYILGVFCEVFLEQSRELTRLHIISCRIGPGAAGIEHIARHTRTARRYLKSEHRVCLSLDIVELSI